MKYKAYFSDDMTYVKKTMDNMAKAASFKTFRRWDIRGDLDDIELACDRDTDDAEYWDIIFANITSSASWGDMSCYERTVTYWNYIVFFLEDYIANGGEVVKQQQPVFIQEDDETLVI